MNKNRRKRVAFPLNAQTIRVLSISSFAGIAGGDGAETNAVPSHPIEVCRAGTKGCATIAC